MTILHNGSWESAAYRQRKHVAHKATSVLDHVSLIAATAHAHRRSFLWAFYRCLRFHLRRQVSQRILKLWTQ